MIILSQIWRKIQSVTLIEHPVICLILLDVSHADDVDNNNADFHKVFAVKTNYSNNYSPGSPLINGRNPEMIISKDINSIKIDQSSTKKRISELNNNYGTGLNRPISSDPYIKNKDYKSLYLQKNLDDFIKFRPNFRPQNTMNNSLKNSIESRYTPSNNIINNSQPYLSNGYPNKNIQPPNVIS